MSLIQDPEPLLFLARFRHSAREFNDFIIEKMSASFSGERCKDKVESEACRDDAGALNLKFIAMACILVAGVVGVSTPLVGRKRRFMRNDSGLFVLAKAFAAGVILATGFVHMLHDAQEALTDPCLPKTPWRSFPFPGFIAMLAALGTLVADFVCTQFYERKHTEEAMRVKATAAAIAAAAEEEERGITVVVSADPEHDSKSDEERGSIVGMHAHADGHRHGHDHGHGHNHSHGHDHRRVGPTTGTDEEHDDSEVSNHVRHVVVSQILELGIVSHSVIIGLSLGVSRSPCTIRPLVAALSFHQFFEGFALGGCISQAQFKTTAAAMMSCFFSITTPLGIAAGAGVASFYNANSPGALAVEGILDSVSAGILIYMALVDLIAADFLSQNKNCSVRLQAASYAALFLGAGCMAALALWA